MHTDYQKLTAYIPRLWKEQFAPLFSEGLIVTPFALINEILDKLPVDWSNPALTFLDPCCGSGRFLMAIKYRLLDAGHSEQHIIEHMIYGCDVDPVNMTGTLDMLGAKVYNHNIKCANSLTEKWTMKFDVVIGNPPYQEGDTGTNKTLFDKFYYLSTSICTGYVVMIAPTMWLLSKKRILQRLRAHLFDTGIYCVKLIDARSTFGVVLDSLGVTFSRMGQPSDSLRAELQDGTTTTVRRDEAVAVLSSNPLERSIINKCTHGTSTVQAKRARQRSVGRNGTCFNGSVSLIQSADYRHKTINKVSSGQIQYVYAKRELDDSTHEDRVVFSYLSSNKNLGDIYIIPKTEHVQLTEACTYVPVVSLSAGESLRSYLKSKVFRFILQRVRPGTNNSGGIFQQINQPPLTHPWTDAELYAHFNLTQEEIDLIESTVK